MYQNTVWKQDLEEIVNVRFFVDFASVITLHLKMAYCMTREEVLAQVLRENAKEYSSFNN